MQTIERRIAVLETANQDHLLNVILVEDGESEEAALIGVGLQPGAKAIFITPLDALL